MIAVETILPFASVTGETVSETGITVPSLRTPSVSKWSIDSPESNVSRIFSCSPARWAGSINPIGWPMASCAE